MRPGEEDPLLERVRAELSDVGLGVEQLRHSLAELLQRCQEQQRLLDRVTRLSDGYQRAERDRGEGYLKHYMRELRRVEKIVRISDRYQDMLRDANTQLASMANTDALTGLPNRRFACEELDSRINLVARNGGELCVALADIDRFKQLNDSFGHAAGDQAIRQVAATFAGGLRNYDLCARWGGEEFLILLPMTSVVAAEALLERVRREIASLSFEHRGSQRSLSVSIGVTQLKGQESASDILRRADEALYLAKNAGRNRVCRSS